MDLIKKIKTKREKIFLFLDKKIKDHQYLFETYDKNKNEYFELLKNFIKRGKGIRGALVLLTDEIFDDKKIDELNLLYLASFFEIMHSVLLIHDDFMDNDKFRRNEKTINYYFYNQFNNLKKNQNHLANSLAVNIGDIGFFIGFDFFNKINSDYKNKEKIFSFIVSEYIKVALAQTDDVIFSQTNIEPDIDTIKKIYLHKTARYTFVLPIISTLYLKKNNLYKNKNLITILEDLGLVFQITDDFIGFLSDETGKDKGSDIRENKKTIIRYFLIEELKDSSLKNIFGKTNLTNKDIFQIRQFYQQSKTKEKIDFLLKNIEKDIYSNLKKINLPKQFHQLILDFFSYLIERKK